MTKDELAIYAREKMYDAIGSVMSQSTVTLTLGETLDLLGVYKLIQLVEFEKNEITEN